MRIARVNNYSQVVVFVCYLLSTACKFCVASAVSDTTCEKLLVGQYTCDAPIIDPTTQEISGCAKNSSARIPCKPLNQIVCNGKLYNGSMIGFYKDVPCRFTNGYSYIVALALSLFLGWLGVDRFYLGYPAIGLLKLCSFGLCGIGALVDFLLIATQVLLPSDGSNYVIDFYGPRLVRLFVNNDTYY
uniref:TM2 domain-containing protein 1-like n=1 Tax=Ciona intestinalis TaxID=7719 RepID=F6YV39_CIOIN|nr:TM2 domain-containing protein 1-like [Ciona intestinalis]|eukprot:XP_002131850.1 TM2 domain-containing protein 1-like [Ciona intestinalis]